jgi:sortase B
MSKKSRKNKKKNMIFRVAGIALLLVLVIGVAWLGKQKLNEKQRSEATAQLQNLYNNPVKTQNNAGTESSDKENETKQSSALRPITAMTAAAAPAAPSATAAPTEIESNLVFQSDFDELYAINPDVVGWIDVGNYMSMPVVYKDNSFYLDHDYYGNPDNAGTLFINEANTIWPNGETPADQNLLFHGHNMRDGSIFGDLDEYRKLEYMQQNVIVYFRTIYDYDPIPYVIFGAFDMSATPGEAGYFDIGYINFDDDAEFEEYTNGILRRSFYNMPYGVERNDRMLSLITCSYSNENGRFTLFCRELHEDETVDSVLEAAKLITKK